MMRRFIKSKGHGNPFSASRKSIKATWTKLLTLFLCRRMILSTLILYSGRLKKRLLWSRWNDVSRCRKAIRTQFLHPCYRIWRLGRSCLNDVLCRWMALRTHNLPSGRLKKRLWWIRWSVFKESKCHAISFSATWAWKKETWTKSFKSFY
jgi:hypothetical protein